jgi:hypothetical protein
MRVSKEAYKGSNKIAIGDYCWERVPNFLYIDSVLNHNNMTE